MVLAETTGEDRIFYLHGLDLVAQSDGVNTEYFAYDGLGSVRQVLDADASPLLTQTYDPYGGIYESVGAGETNYGFTGEQVDESGLVYLRARYYHPSMGRFLNADPSRQEMNPYQYAIGNPAMYADPSGLCIFTGLDTAACIIALAIGIPVIAGVTTAAWDYNVTQGGGLGGANQGRPDCIDWGHVLDAGRDGFFGSVDSLIQVPLGTVYLFGAVVYGMSPTEVNETVLSVFGLDDEYRAALQGPYVEAGQVGGNFAGMYISLGTFLRGLPTLSTTSTNPGFGGNGIAVLSMDGVAIVGGNGTLVWVGSTGLLSSGWALASRRGGGGGSSPELPPRRVVRRGGVTIEHNYRSGDHAPPHLHVRGQGRTTRITWDGEVLAGSDPQLSPRQRRVVSQNIDEINEALEQIQAWLDAGRP